MTRAIKTLGALVLIIMTMSSAFMPFALAAGNFSNAFSDGTAIKDAMMPVGGGDSSGIYLRLLPNETIKHLNLTLSPKPTIINKSIEIPLDEGFNSGTYSDSYISADNNDLQAKLYSFKHLEYFIDDKGIDPTNTTANILYEEGLPGVALSVNKSANFTIVYESPHVNNAIKLYDWGGRLIKNLTVNASGNSPGTVSGQVRGWNTQSRRWEDLYNVWNMGPSISNVTMVQQNYTVPIYSQLDVRAYSWWGGTQWYNLNVTFEGFNNSSVVTSAPIDPVKSFNWDKTWTVHDCTMETVRDIPANTHMTLELSPDNGTTWENAISGGDHTFAKPGAVLRWRAQLSADVANVTPILRNIFLACHRNIYLGDYSWHSRDYHISEGAITSYSVSWYGDIPSGTGVEGLAQRWAQDPTTSLSNGALGTFQYNRSLQNISFSIFLTPGISRSPHISRIVFNYTVVVMPSDVAIDVGNDGSFEWSMKGELQTALKINSSDAKALVVALNARSPRTGASVNVPLRLISSAGGSVTLKDLKVEYGLPPVLETRISMISINEDTNRTSLVSLDDHFTDDYNPLHLNYSISYMEAPTKVLATLRGPLLDISLPTRYWNGPSIIRVRATDLDGTSTESNNITVMVWPVDAPPVITYLPTDVPAYVGASFVGQVKAFDPEGHNLTYRLDAAPPNAVIDKATGLILWWPTIARTWFFRVNISDGLNTVVADFNFSAVVDLTKASPPVFVTVPSTNATVKNPYMYMAKAVDLDNDPLEFQLLQGPGGMTVNATSGQVLWWPTVAQLGYQSVTLRVSDGAFSADQDYRILVLNSVSVNKPPQISSTPPESAWVGRPYVYQLKAKDPDAGTFLWYQLAQGPTTMSLDDGGRIIWVPTANDIGDQAVKVVVNDGVVQVPQTWTITVHSTERTCLISTPAPSEVVKDKLVIKGLASGPNNLTKVEVRIGDDNNWQTATGTSKWHLELNTSNLGTGYFFIRARACDGITCSKESEVRFYHQGSGSSVSSGLSSYWWAAILVIIVIIVLLLVDLKMKFIKGPRDKKASMYDEDLDLDIGQEDRSVYHKKDR